MARICNPDINQNSSEMFINKDKGNYSNTRGNNTIRWPRWGPCNCNNNNPQNKNYGIEQLNPNQELIYKGAIRHAQSENDELRGCVNGLNQQINELRIENDGKNEAIDKLHDYLMQYTNGDFERQLNNQS
jgi:hypothetical protein